MQNLITYVSANSSISPVCYEKFLQHPYVELVGELEEIEEGYAFVTGFNKRRQHGPMKKLDTSTGKRYRVVMKF